jgi:hypothetical protein
VVLRVDELSKLGGRPCPHLREVGGCSIHARRPSICRAYRCLWLRGGLEDGDRPDRLGAVVDVDPGGGAPFLAIRQSRPGVFDASPRLQAIAAAYRESLPVHVTDVEDVMDPERPLRILLPGGEEQQVEGDVLTLLRHGHVVERRRLSWLGSRARRLLQRWRALRIARRHARPPAV